MPEKSPERLKVLEKINEFEKAGRFNDDVEEDAPAKMLMPDEVDYLRYGFFAKWKARRTIELARKALKMLEKNHQFILKEIKGAENIKGLETGAVMTSNHFSPMESFAVHLGFEAAFGKHKKKRFYRVISEGNYTTYAGPFSFLMKNADTLPLSSNKETIHKFMTSVDTLLKDGHIVLVYPEQSMWWNYRKPRPFREGAFRFAVKSKVPVIPVFITMKDSEYFDGEGFPVQEYTVHIEKPIYADESKSKQENIKYMMEENYRIWKEIYEREYGIPLTYLCDESNNSGKNGESK